MKVPIYFPKKRKTCNKSEILEQLMEPRNTSSSLSDVSIISSGFRKFKLGLSYLSSLAVRNLKTGFYLKRLTFYVFISSFSECLSFLFAHAPVADLKNKNEAFGRSLSTGCNANSS